MQVRPSGIVSCVLGVVTAALIITAGCVHHAPSAGPVAGCDYWYDRDHVRGFFYMTGHVHENLMVKTCYDRNGVNTDAR